MLCIDTSGSMQGEPERIAKTVCFALTKIALSENRKCYLISFSTQIQTLELTDLHTNLNALVNFLRMSFYGGTDATPALSEALRMLQTENYKKADVLMISDFIMDNLPSRIVNQIQKSQENKTRFHSLVIGKSENQKVTSVFDNNWVYDPQKHGIKELVKNIKQARL